MNITKEQIIAKLTAHQEKVNAFIARVRNAFGEQTIEGAGNVSIKVRKDHDDKWTLVFTFPDDRMSCGYDFLYLFEADPNWGYIQDHVWCYDMKYEALVRTKKAIEDDNKLMANIEELFLTKIEKDLEEFFA